MKKFVIMTLVLCLASYASAGLSWTVTGSTSGNVDPTKVASGDTLTLTLIEAGDTVISAIVDHVTDSSSEGLFTSSAVGAFNTVNQSGMSVPTFDTLAGDVSGMPLDDWCYIDALTTSPFSGTVLTLGYTAPTTLGIYNITGQGHAWLSGGSVITETAGGATGLPALGITVIPEPMTMVLLGLGGLFLRRRK